MTDLWTTWGHYFYSVGVSLALFLYWISHQRKRPLPPKSGNLYIMRPPLYGIKKGTVMANVLATFTKSPSPNVNQYTVLWVRTPAGGSAGSPVPQNIPQSNAFDASGYSADFNTGNPGVVLAPGDTVSASIVADDTIHGAVSTAVAETPASVTIPVPPPPPAPEPPVAGTLTATA
jgi:hypothetical protein